MKRAFCLGVFIVGITMLFGCMQPPQDTNTLVVWHWMVDRQNAFETLAEEYKQKTGVSVKFKLYAPSDIYSQKVIAAAQAKILPDIYGILDTKETIAAFISGGFVADLTGEFKKDDSSWEQVFFPKALAVNRFDENNTYNIKPGIYGVPLDVMNIQMLYNKKLLMKAGFKQPPKTFEEFLEMTDKLNSMGISGLVSGWGELWMIDCFAFNYAFNIMGEEKVMDTYRGKVKYTDPDWIKVFKVFETLAKRNALAVGIVTKVNKFAEQDFALERAAFAFNGSWCVNVYKNMNPDLEYGVILPPKISNDHPFLIWGGAGSSFYVNKGSVKKDKAVAFLKWLTAQEQQTFLSNETLNLPANRHALATIPQILSDFTVAMDQITHPAIWPLDENALVKEKFDMGLQSIIIGEKTPEQVAIEVQTVKDRQMAKKRF